MKEGGKRSTNMNLETNIHLMYRLIKVHFTIIVFMCRGIQEFGKLPQSIKDNTTLKGFVRLLRSELLKRNQTIRQNTFTL